MAVKKKPSLQGLQGAVDLNSPNLTDDQFVQAGDQQGAQLGEGQWLDHTNARRTKTVTDATTQAPSPAVPFATASTLLANPVGDAIRQQSLANAIDPDGALGYYAQRQDPALLRKKQAAASLAALTQVAQ